MTTMMLLAAAVDYRQLANCTKRSFPFVVWPLNFRQLTQPFVVGGSSSSSADLLRRHQYHQHHHHHRRHHAMKRIIEWYLMIDIMPG